jgi:hypothetical protein
VTGKLKVLDNLIGSLRAQLPTGYNFNFFITQADELSVRGVWYLSVNKEIRKQIQSEKQSEKQKLKVTRRKRA